MSFGGMFGPALANLFNNKAVDTNATDSIKASNDSITEAGGSFEGESYDADFDINDPDAVKNIQSKLVDSDANALPQYGVDGKWGDESQNAYNKYMSEQNQTPIKQAFSNSMENSWLENEGGGGVSVNPDTGYKNPVYAAPEWGLKKQF